MSSATYDELWGEAETLLTETVQADAVLQGAKPLKDRKKVHNVVSTLYIRYSLVSNKLEQCYEQVIQPQKRLLLKRLLDASLGRVLELKHELVNVDLSECSYYDDVLIECGVTPQEAEIRVPRYFRREQIEQIEERWTFVESTLRNLGTLRETVVSEQMTESQAIRLIQAHERARQGRLRYQFMKEIRQMKDRSIVKPEVQEEDQESEKLAAMKIQKLWRGYITRRRIRKRRLEEMLLIGMLQPGQTITENARRAEKVKQQRYEKQMDFQQQYQDLVSEAKERICREKSAVMEENIRSEIRNWIDSYFQQTGKIPDLPSVENGGSRMIFSRQGTESTVSKSTALSSKESKKSKRSKSKKDSETEQSEDETDLGFKSVPSNFLSELIRANQEYQDVWKNKDESMNPMQLPYRDMIEAEKTKETEDEVRLVVDQAMRGDTRQLIAEYCILPLGNEVLRELTPLVRSVLIAGPRGSGKKFLVNAICTELGATLFDITPANIAGKYPSRSGQIMLVHLISKVSRLLQPSVIFMDEAEKPFVKKVPKTDKTDPKRMKKDLPRLVRNVTAEDRVLIVGTSNKPWDGDQKLLFQAYDKVIYIPRPDYGSMSLVWKDLLYKYSGISRQFDTSAMAKACDGFTIGTVLAVLDEVMTTKRMVQLRTHPLTHAELVNALSFKDPVYREEEDAFLAWFSKTPTCRRKQRALELELERLNAENEKKKMKKGK
ncbi:dynein regulatory complex protein 11 isoform X2 [Ooceraea biroi]|uniref:dynein regulatory complex protein 11 isoform X2 n=1 Tax=Ooceraea biroi TaxID=2015173 RepID=UPI0005BB0397|nr:dynein regulatory complex protein 11 isoform X2 [Ooceraea biroi]